MSLLVDIFLLAVVLTLGFLLTTKAIPWVFVRIGRLLGFQLKASPVTKKRIDRFKRIKRGYYSFLVITTLFVTSLFLELICNSRPLVIAFDGRVAFPAVSQWVDKAVFFTEISTFNKKDEFGFAGKGAGVDYKMFARWVDDPAVLQALIDEKREDLAPKLAKVETIKPKAKPKPGDKGYERKLKTYERKMKRYNAMKKGLEKSHEVFKAGRAWLIMPVYPYGPSDFPGLELERPPPHKPSIADRVPLGTEMSGRDVLALLVYGFRISIAFALTVAICGYAFGIVIGAVQGYYGGWTDIISQRIVEIWGSIPFLLTIMIIASIVQPTFGVLVLLLFVLRSWLGITFYIRGEFYREKAKDYVQAAIGAGVSDWKVMIRHILPNALVPIVTFAPFAMVGYISILVSLDYLGFGLPPGTPSWGDLLKIGLERVKFDPHLIIVPTTALMLTLYSVVMIGEAVREAFDPKVFSRLR